MFRQETGEFEGPPLVGRKGGSLVKIGIIEQRGTCDGTVLVAGSAEREVAECGVLFVGFGHFVVGGHGAFIE